MVQPPQGGAQTPKGDLAQAVAKTEFLASGARSFSMASRNLTGGGVGGNGSRMASPAGTLHQESAAGRVTRVRQRSTYHEGCLCFFDETTCKGWLAFL